MAFRLADSGYPCRSRKWKNLFARFGVSLPLVTSEMNVNLAAPLYLEVL